MNFKQHTRKASRHCLPKQGLEGFYPNLISISECLIIVESHLSEELVMTHMCLSLICNKIHFLIQICLSKIKASVVRNSHFNFGINPSYWWKDWTASNLTQRKNVVWLVYSSNYCSSSLHNNRNGFANPRMKVGSKRSACCCCSSLDLEI